MHRFPAEVTFDNASAVLEAAASEAGSERVFDLSACLRFDSSLIAVMLELMRRAQAEGGRCRFDGASENLLRLAGLYGVAALLFGTALDSLSAARSTAPERPSAQAPA
jgi:ABC-type transporter Mla MlaB component